MMRTFYCKVGVHHVPECSIFDLRVKVPICHICRAKMLALRAAEGPKKVVEHNNNPAIPGRAFRMIVV